ncbi:MAG: protoporphyrinogen oxidase [Vicinamibacterales bacterium]
MSDTIVIGGGIAGLSAAWEIARRGGRPLVLEQGPRAGGVILTEHIDGFVIDGGPDALLIQKPAAVALCQELGLGDRLFPTTMPRTAFVLRKGRLVPLPEASFLGIPIRIAPFVTTRLFSWPGKLRMGLEVVIPRKRDAGADESIGSFMRRRFGQEAVTYLAEPLLAGIHAGDVERLSMRALFPRLLDAEQARGSVIRSLRAMKMPPSPKGAFLSLPGGIGEFADTLVAKLPPGTVRTGAGVATVEGAGPYRVTLTSGETLEARTVVVAVPAWAAAPMLEPLDRELAARCREIPYVSSATVAFGLKREQVRHPLSGSGFVVPRAERKALMAASWVSSKWAHRAPEGMVLLRGFLGGAYDPEVLQQNDQTLTRLAFDELSALLGITGEPVLTRVYRWPRASAQHEVGHHARMAAIDARLAAHPGLFVTGSGFRGSGIPDCVSDGRATGAGVMEQSQGA